MSRHRRLISSLVAWTILGVVGCGGKKTAVEEMPSVLAGLVPDDAFAAAILYPRRALPSLAANPAIKDRIDHLNDLSPLELDQLALLMGPSVGSDHWQQGAFIARFASPQDSAAVARKWLKPFDADENWKPVEFDVAGHKCFCSEKNPTATRDQGICFFDERTMIKADKSWLPKILAAKDAKSPLISALGSVDSAADATILFTNNDAAKEMFAHMVPAKLLVGPLTPIGELPELLQSATLSVRTRPEISLKLTLVGKDADSAAKIAGMIDSFQKLGQSMLPTLEAPAGANIPAEERERNETVVKLAGKLINGFTPNRAGDQVTVEINGIAKLGELSEKLILPWALATRKTARRMQSSNNLRQLGLAMQFVVANESAFPASAICSKEGKPLLSWRVSLLPFLDEQKLYKQFHLDEPWDSPNNKPLIAKMPAVFKSSGSKSLADGQTRYVVAAGKNTIFNGSKRIRPDDIKDGVSNTILILEAGDDKGVTWTKPDDIDFDPEKPLAGLGTIDPDGFNAVFADCSVYLIRSDVDSETFRRLILPNDGLPVDPSKLR